MMVNLLDDSNFHRQTAVMTRSIEMIIQAAVFGIFFIISMLVHPTSQCLTSFTNIQKSTECTCYAVNDIFSRTVHRVKRFGVVSFQVVNCLVYIRIVVFMHMFSISLDILFVKINGSRVDKHILKDHFYEFDAQNNFIYHVYDIWLRPPVSCHLDRKKTESCQLRNVLGLKRSM